MLDRGVDRIRAHERALTQRLIDGLRGVAGVRVFGTLDANRQTAAVSFTTGPQGRVGHDGRDSPGAGTVSALAQALDERFEILCRPGLHCAPRAHRTLGTLPEGTVRLAPGLFTTDAEIDQTIDAIAHLVGGT